MRLRTGLVPLLFLATRAVAVDVEGVLPASLDQPRIYLAVCRPDSPTPLAAKGEKGGDVLAGLLGEKPDKNTPPAPNVAIEAFLDTGASGTMLSQTTADALGVKSLKVNGRAVKFYDVGVAGKEEFGVAEPLRLRAAEYSGKNEGADLGAYSAPGPVAHVKIRPGGGLLEMIGGALDIAGTPLMNGRIMAVDCRPLKDFDKLRTRLVPPGDKSVPKADVKVALTMVDFERFTQTDPKNGPKVDSAPNPMIGPHPFNKSDSAKPIVITHRGKSAKLTMLLDTGAAASMISTAKAKELGLDVGDDGKVKGVAAKDAFTLPIGGIGGSADVPGTFVDGLVLPAAAGEPVRYVRAPVLIKDITVQDEATGESFTLDGVFGMNYLVASASVTGGLNAGVDDIHDGAFDHFYVDFPGKMLGLTVKKR